MIREYMDAAMAKAKYEPLQDPAEIYGHIPCCPGVWATGATLEDCRKTLEEVLEGWILLGIRAGDDLPEIDGKQISIPEPIPMPIEHRQILEARLKAHPTNAEDLVSWEAIRERYLGDD